jgi:aryl-alcohol dehydrogenase-like predicted oxidoreductase
VNSHPQITSTLLGARNIKQLAENLEAENINITQELRKKISSLSIEPPLATDR